MSQKNFVSFGDAETLFTELGDKLTPTFTGTVAEWEALSTAEKTKYKQAVFTDDYSDNPVGNLSALTTTDKSSCVGAINEINGKIGSYEVIASVTGDGVKTYSDAIDELIPYRSQADLFIDGSNIYYPRNERVYSSINIETNGSLVLYGVRFDDNNKYFKKLTFSTGTEANLLNTVIAEGGVLKLCKRL